VRLRPGTSGRPVAWHSRTMWLSFCRAAGIALVWLTAAGRLFVGSGETGTISGRVSDDAGTTEASRPSGAPCNRLCFLAPEDL
jgi:hypothetical protein